MNLEYLVNILLILLLYYHITIIAIKVFLYEGKTGSKLCDLSEAVGIDGHKGSVFAVSWSSDSKRLLTSSADKTVKIWDIESQKVIQ